MKKTEISYRLNILTVLLVLAALVIMLTGFQFMGYEKKLSANSVQAFRFFTVDSNLLLGLAAFMLAREEKRTALAGAGKVRDGMILFKYTAVVSTTLTFFIVAAVFAPGMPGGYFSMIKNTNLFYHLIVPVTGMISFIFFEDGRGLKFRHTFTGLIPMVIYGVIYAINVFSHAVNGRVPRKYDWYGFVSAGTDTAASAVISMFIITYLICLALFGANRLVMRKNRS